MALDWLLRPILVLYTIFLTLTSLAFSQSDSEALIRLKNSFTKAEALGSWVSGSNPCKGEPYWNGVVCSNGAVVGLRLEKMGLSGKIDVDALADMSRLRTLSLANNSFSGLIPEFNQLGYLKALYLTGNKFSGVIPSDYFLKMKLLKKIWLADNDFTGPIPSSLAKLPHLMELRLENNQLSGIIPALMQPTLVLFNVSNNELEGQIPLYLAWFNASAFNGNKRLCHDPNGSCAYAIMAASSVNAHKQKIGRFMEAFIGTVVLVIMLLCVAAALVLTMKGKKTDPARLGTSMTVARATEAQVLVPAKQMEMQLMKTAVSSCKGSHRGFGDLTMVNDEKGVFGLPDLMKAAAEVLGNGGLGLTYKAVMANGVSVVVKRMREMNALGRDGFAAELRKMGSLRHTNILTPLAFHYRKDEKLLVYEYIPKGSLLYMLHGDRGPSHDELDWPARLKIVRGVARGLVYLHTKFASSILPHGNLKSSNIFLGPENEPLLSEFGFNPLVSKSFVSQALVAYKAPEAIHSRISPKCDVYCLGIIIFEVLTGKFPSQYLNNAKGGADLVHWVSSAISEGKEYEVLDPEIARSTNSIDQMKQLLMIGAACTETIPEQGLDLREAIQRIEEILLEGVNDGGLHQTKTMQGLPLHQDGYIDAHHVNEINMHECYGDYCPSVQ